MMSSYRDDVDQFVARLLGLLLQVGRDVDDVERRAEFLARPDQGLHLEQIDHA